MRILAASDLHGFHASYRWLAQVACERELELVVLAGDLLGCPDEYATVEEAQQQDAKAIEEILEPIPIPVYYIMGNDDLVELNPRTTRMASLHGKRIEVGMFNLIGYQYSLPFMGGIFEKPEEQICEDLAGLSADARTIFVTHSPAHGVLDRTWMGDHAGSHSILDFVGKHNVRAHIHGHIHKCFGTSGRHFNVASGGLCRAMIIDLENLEATEISGATPD